MNIEIDTESIKSKVIEDVTKEVENHLTQIAKSSITSDYALGVQISNIIKNYISTNLEKIVKKELESVDIKEKVDKAVSRAVLDLVHQQLKKMSM